MGGLCVSSLLGVLRSHIWLIGEEEMAWLLARTTLPCYQHHRSHSLSFSLCSSSADGGSEDLADPRSPSLDPHLSHIGQGKKTLHVLFYLTGLHHKLFLRTSTSHTCLTPLENPSFSAPLLLINESTELLPVINCMSPVLNNKEYKS